MENYKKVIGRTVVEDFEKRVTPEMFTEKNYSETLTVAADLAEEMPFVTMPFRESGILGRDEGNAKILHTFQPNLWAQDYAFLTGRLDKMTVGTAKERSEASSEFVLNKSSNLSELLRRKGKTAYDFVNTFKESAMIEAAYYTRLGGGEMAESVRKKIDTAIMRRAIRDKSMFQTVLRSMDIKETDGLALLQFSEEMDLTGILQKLTEMDPYYNRRINQIDAFAEMNAEASVTLPQIRANKFVEELVMRIGKRYPAVVKKVAEAVGQ